MDVKFYSTLPVEARAIRERVFVEEQGFVEEFDDIDDIATHLVLFDEEAPVGTCRFYWSEERGGYIVGRIAVNKERRGQNLGTYLMGEVEVEIRRRGSRKIFLMAQVQAMAFYERLGYIPFGAVCYDEGCPHRWLEKVLV